MSRTNQYNVNRDEEGNESDRGEQFHQNQRMNNPRSQTQTYGSSGRTEGIATRSIMTATRSLSGIRTSPNNEGRQNPSAYRTLSFEDPIATSTRNSWPITMDRQRHDDGVMSDQMNSEHQRDEWKAHVAATEQNLREQQQEINRQYAHNNQSAQEVKKRTG